MAVRIRLTRVGAKKQPSYRFVVADSRNARDGRSLETLGHYNPRTEPIEINVNADRARDWMRRGALPSDTVARLFRQAGVMPPAAKPAPLKTRAPKSVKPAKAAKSAEAAPPSEPAKPAESAEPAQPAEATEASEAIESAEPAAADDTAEVPESAEAAEPVESKAG